MASHAMVLQNPSIIPSSPHSSFFPVIPSRISFVSRFDSIIVNAYLPILRLEPKPGERREAESSLEEDNDSINAKKKKKERKKELRPNFYHQTLKKWSVKIASQRTKLPWQEQEQKESERVVLCSPPTGMPVEPSTNPTGLPFFDGRAKSRTALLDLEIDSLDRVEKLPRSSYHARTRNSQRDFAERNSHTKANCIKLGIPLPLAPWAQRVESQRSSLKHDELFLARDTGFTDSSNDDEPSSSSSTVSSSVRRGVELMMQESGAISLPRVIAKTRKKSQFNVDEAASTIPSQNPKYDAKSPKNKVTVTNENLEESMDNHNPEDASSNVGSYHENIPKNSLLDSYNSTDSLSFPWGNANGVSNVDLVRRRSNTDMAERTIPEPELRRLRNEALRMKERMTVGPAGITEAVVENIHQKWKEVEIVKLHIEGPPSLNMKRTNEILEIKTGGIAIWRSGSSIVLYRGLNYKLPCARFLSRISDATSSMDDSEYSNHSSITKAATKVLEQSDVVELSDAKIFECSSDASHIDSILNELGPRYEDWSGRDPLPVDADLLPGIVPGYKPPFRLLPYKTKRSLTNRQMTFLRRIARSMAPHFALGRSKQLQGLANGMVKLWETSAIVKIAIKRGVQNTSNERMAEEIKELTGGTLLSRNKEYIVFYRGNDFLTPCIRDTLIEREKLATVQQDAEEEARCRASGLINSNPKAIKRVPYLAGTLTETLKACNHWANHSSSNDRDEMRRDLALSQQESVIRNLERKLSFAMAKVRNAEKTLAKVQEAQRPADLPTDLETVTDEERSLFRKIGLKMRSYLPLGRRGVFDGTIQNIHLSWKHMELAKIIVKANKNLGQVKHIAISLEAESGGVLISVDETTKGYVIILYRGKNYQRPKALRPNNLLSKREALQRSIELQRRQALNYHIANLQEQIQILKSQLRLKSSFTGKEAMKTDNEVVDAFSDNDPNLDT